MNDLIKCNQSGGLLTLTINRPDKLNALSNSMYNRLADLLFAAEQDPETAVIIITCLLYTSPSPRDGLLSRMPSSA